MSSYSDISVIVANLDHLQSNINACDNRYVFMLEATNEHAGHLIVSNHRRLSNICYIRESQMRCEDFDL